MNTKVAAFTVSEKSVTTSNDIGKWLKHSFGLHYLYSSDVEDSFFADVMSATPEDNRCSK